MATVAMPASVSNAGPTSLVGAVLSRRFRLVSLLGQGGMGLVYEAEVLAPTPGLPPRVAVKLLRAEHLADEQVRARFLEEGRACMRLVHPNLLHVFEVDSAEDGSPYLVMDRLEGYPLNVIAPVGRPIPAARAVRIVQGVLAGLAVAHAQGVVHRDLKPENVFVMPGDIGKVLDFGIAKVMDAAGGQGSRTRTGMLLGTPAFMSPEQARSAREADHRSDLWSVAVMLYEIVTGREAFPAPTEFARLTMILTAEPEPPSAISPALGGFDAFFKRALQKDKTLRFQSAAEMSQALAGVPLPASMVPPPMAPQPAVPRVDPTLSSPHQPPPEHAPVETPQHHPASYRPPQPVVVVPSATADPVSFAGPRSNRGISQIVVVLLVSFALMAGFVLGFAVARSM
jgi:serine/threonine-protein kinase